MPLAAVLFVVTLLVSGVAALVSALPVWSAYCLPQGDGALDVVVGVSSRDIVSETSSCVWPRASVVWSGPDGALHTDTLAANWRFASPSVVLGVGVVALVLVRRSRRRVENAA